MLASVIAFAALLAGGGGFAFFATTADGDQLSESQQRSRAQAFYAYGPIALAPVHGAELGRALASMELPAEQQQGLMRDLAAQAGARTAAVALPAADPAAAPSEPVGMAWLTLWDNEVQDGDIVRVISSGYSRLVHLSSQPISFAIPVPPSGVINIAGVHDGGGGITVGMMSGGAPVALPVMVEGQVLGVPVRVP